jgi:hypothetical protein
VLLVALALHAWFLVVALLALVVGAAYGWQRRSRAGVEKTWPPTARWLAYGLQAAVALAANGQVVLQSAWVAQVWQSGGWSWSGAGDVADAGLHHAGLAWRPPALVVLVVLVLVVEVALALAVALAIVCAWSWVAAAATRRATGRAYSWRDAYGFVGAVGGTVALVSLLVESVGAFLAAAVWRGPAAGARDLLGIGTRPDTLSLACFGAAVVVVTVVAVLFVDLLRRWAPGAGYKIGALLAGGLGGYLLGLVAARTWVPSALAGTAVVVLLVALAVVLSNLTFLGSYALVTDVDAHRDDMVAFSLAQATQVIAWRDGDDGSKPTGRVYTRAQVVFPSLRDPRGLVQRKVSELFDSDDPPFYKHFLVMTSTHHTLTITPQPVDGRSRPGPLPPVVIDLRRLRSTPGSDGAVDRDGGTPGSSNGSTELSVEVVAAGVAAAGVSPSPGGSRP